MLSQFTCYPVEELKLGWLAVSTNSHLATENLHLKLTISINWLTNSNWSIGESGNRLIKLSCMYANDYSLTDNFIFLF